METKYIKVRDPEIGESGWAYISDGKVILDNTFERIPHGSILELEEDGYTIYTIPENFISVKDGLTNLGYDETLVSEVTFIPDNYISLDEELKEKALTLIEQLEDIDDVQNVYHNLDI